MKKQKSSIQNLAINKDIVTKFVDSANSEYNRVKSLREQFEDSWEVADYMYKAAQNRTINAAEVSKGMNLKDDPRANLGSPMFWRQISQIASEGVAVENSRDVPFKFNPIVNQNVQYSSDQGQAESDQLNSLVRYTMKHDKYKEKSTCFWTSLAKYGNIPYMINWALEVRTIDVEEPVYEVITDEAGNEVTKMTGRKRVSKEVVVKAHPEQRMLNIFDIFADPYIGDLQSQSCVIVPSIVNKSAIYNEVRKGIYDEDAYDLLSDDDAWDGQEGVAFRQRLLENNDKTWEESKGIDQYLKWDIWFRAPIENGKWDEKAVPVLYFATIIGNTLDGGKVMTIIRNPDPDDEIPIRMIHLYPDDADLLYHVAPADIMRSNYSAECSLKCLTIDNMALACRPPTTILEGEMYVKPDDLKWDASGRVWTIIREGAIQQMAIRDNTQQTVGLLEYFKAESQSALGTDKNRLGESFGARTSALEANNIFQLSSQPSLAWINYVLQQKIGFFAQKTKSLWRAYGTPSVINAITDMPLLPNVSPTDMMGDFDTQIDIVDEYINDMQAQQMLMGLVRMVAQAPQLLKSDTHEIDIGALMKDIFSKSGLNGDKYIRARQDGDAARWAEMENVAMTQNGQATVVNVDDNDYIHLRIHKSYRMRYNGFEEQFPNLSYLDAHILEHEAIIQSESGDAAAQAPNGEVPVGGEMAGAMSVAQ